MKYTEEYLKGYGDVTMKEGKQEHRERYGDTGNEARIQTGRETWLQERVIKKRR